MNIYIIRRKGLCDYDEYDSAVVVAESEEDAKKINPDRKCFWENDSWYYLNSINEKCKVYFGGWVTPSQVDVEKIGIADLSQEKGVVVSSFNAG